MNNNLSHTSFTVEERLFEHEEKMRQTQTYKKKNQKHPAFKK